MHPKIIAKKIIDFNKANFDNTFDAITILQDHSEKMISLFLQQATLFPDEGKKVISQWLESYKKGRKDFKEAVDNHFQNVEKFFLEGGGAIGFTYCGDEEGKGEFSDVFQKTPDKVLPEGAKKTAGTGSGKTRSAKLRARRKNT